MRLSNALLFAGCLLLTSCSLWKPASSSQPDTYVEIPNPAITIGNNQPATIWVPRRYEEGGPPRGGALVQKGVDKAFPSNSDQQSMVSFTSGVKTSSTPQAPSTPKPSSTVQSPTTVAIAPSPVAPAPVAPAVLKHRVVILEIGQNGLLQNVQEQLQRSGIAIIADPAQAMFLAQSAQLTGPEAKSSFAMRLQQEYNVNEVIYLSAPGLAPGKSVTAEVYDTMGGVMLRGFDVVIPAYKETDQAAKAAAVAEALTGIATRVKELFPNLPWYSKISAVNGNRAYITAGKEAGLRVGQTLKIYRGGKAMKGLGFAPGSKIGVLEVDGFVGPNAAFCAIKDGQGIESSDVVSSD
jgi:hypothetical protein